MTNNIKQERVPPHRSSDPERTDYPAPAKKHQGNHGAGTGRSGGHQPLYLLSPLYRHLRPAGKDRAAAVAAAAGRGKPKLDLAGNAEKLFRVSGTGFHHSLGKRTALFCPDRTERRHCLFAEH